MSLAGWFIVSLALLCANLPFLNQRLFALAPLPRVDKPIAWRLGELVVLYGVVGLISRALEARTDNVFQQGWQFYVITFSMFLVFAFPGFVFRYLINKRR